MALKLKPLYRCVQKWDLFKDQNYWNKIHCFLLSDFDQNPTFDLKNLLQKLTANDIFLQGVFIL